MQLAGTNHAIGAFQLLPDADKSYPSTHSSTRPISFALSRDFGLQRRHSSSPRQGSLLTNSKNGHGDKSSSSLKSGRRWCSRLIIAIPAKTASGIHFGRPSICSQAMQFLPYDRWYEHRRVSVYAGLMRL